MSRRSQGRRALQAVRSAIEGLRRSQHDEELRQAFRAELLALPRALAKTVPWALRNQTGRVETLLDVILENAKEVPGQLALEMDDVRLSWKDLADLTSRIAHVLHREGVRPGDVVALYANNSPFYVAALFGIVRVGAIAALINNHLEGHPLTHAITVSKARAVIVDQKLLPHVDAREDLRDVLRVKLVYGSRDFDEAVARASVQPFPPAPVKSTDDYVYIYTSGTTGLPKPCRVSHARGLLAGAGFGPLMFDLRPGDKIYCVLPLYHANALLIGLSSAVLMRTPMAMRESFSAKAFWSDVRRYRATAMIYIGELCRYLVNTPPSEDEKNNTIRVAVGNGLRPDIWETFQQRFGVERVREFYAATEAPGLILNLSGRVGSVGRVPLQSLGFMLLARYDIDRDEHVRTSDGFCVEAEVGEVGELLIRLAEKPTSAATEFRGYTDPQATKKKVLTDVFEPGDRFFRSGDLLRRDKDGFFYFVDRIGDTFRWKGENVSTAEVADVLAQARGIAEATVVGVHLPDREGQAGLAAVVPRDAFDPTAFFAAAQELPEYAQPRFVRVLDKLAKTGTFKIQKAELRREGADPALCNDPLYIRQNEGYVPMTAALWEGVLNGSVRL